MNDKLQISVLRRQKTCLEKQVRKLKAERSHARNRVVRAARQFICVGTPSKDWSFLQLKIAVNQLNQHES